MCARRALCLLLEAGLGTKLTNWLLVLEESKSLHQRCFYCFIPLRTDPLGSPTEGDFSKDVKSKVVKEKPCLTVRRSGPMDGYTGRVGVGRDGQRTQ